MDARIAATTDKYCPILFRNELRMPENKNETSQPDNLTRLLGHLKPDSLAARLVAARAAAPDDYRKAMRDVLQGRLKELKEKDDPDHKA